MSDENPRRDHDEPTSEDSNSSSIRINTNVSSLHASFELQRSSESLSQSLERLSAGLRVKDEKPQGADLIEHPESSRGVTLGYDQAGRRVEIAADDDGFAADL